MRRRGFVERSKLDDDPKAKPKRAALFIIFIDLRHPPGEESYDEPGCSTSVLT